MWTSLDKNSGGHSAPRDYDDFLLRKTQRRGCSIWGDHGRVCPFEGQATPSMFWKKRKALRQETEEVHSMNYEGHAGVSARRCADVRHAEGSSKTKSPRGRLSHVVFCAASNRTKVPPICRREADWRNFHSKRRNSSVADFLRCGVMLYVPCPRSYGPHLTLNKRVLSKSCQIP
ncbi:uncharacterized protein LOC110986373 [Acanthaster planci]|uniref:Uncharacterized protein LOC110986373 n=1 Tax=Acanthaster planci TaxID=133434 RepID=A0A8B7ZKP2_ACAPL|nr:uncharacterized protein LOC110986373 [Acanthaster planci]